MPGSNGIRVSKSGISDLSSVSHRAAMTAVLFATGGALGSIGACLGGWDWDWDCW